MSTCSTSSARISAWAEALPWGWVGLCAQANRPSSKPAADALKNIRRLRSILMRGCLSSCCIPHVLWVAICTISPHRRVVHQPAVAGASSGTVRKHRPTPAAGCSGVRLGPRSAERDPRQPGAITRRPPPFRMFSSWGPSLQSSAHRAVHGAGQAFIPGRLRSANPMRAAPLRRFVSARGDRPRCRGPHPACRRPASPVPPTGR